MTLYTELNCELLLRPSQTEDGSPQWYPRHSRYGTSEASSMGLVPVGDYPDTLPDQQDFKAIIEECHAEKIFPMYHMQASKVFDAGWYQKSWGFCWAYGLTANVIGQRSKEGKPPKRLSPFSLAWLVSYKNSGYFCDKAIAGARMSGIATVDFVPEYTTDRSRFKDGWQDNAKLHRPTEWWDVDASNHLQTCRQALSILRTGTPLYIAYEWWRHALSCVGMEWDESQPYGIVWLDWNSHNDGIIRLGGTKGKPDELYGVRATALTDE